MRIKMQNILTAAAVIGLPLSAFATQYRIVDQPRQECWNEQVATQARGNDYGAALIGGVAGGLLGSTVGGGNGRNAAAAIGAVTGALTGDRLYGGQGGVGYQNVQRCRTVVDHVKVAIPEPQTYYAPGPVAVPVVVEQDFYVVPPSVYREDWRAEKDRREHWRHEEWERRREHERRHHEWHEDHPDD